MKPARFQIDTLNTEIREHRVKNLVDLGDEYDSMDKLLEMDYTQYKTIWHLFYKPSRTSKLIKVLEDLNFKKK